MYICTYYYIHLLLYVSQNLHDVTAVVRGHAVEAVYVHYVNLYEVQFYQFKMCDTEILS